MEALYQLSYSPEAASRYRRAAIEHNRLSPTVPGEREMIQKGPNDLEHEQLRQHHAGREHR